MNKMARNREKCFVLSELDIYCDLIHHIKNITSWQRQSTSKM